MALNTTFGTNLTERLKNFLSGDKARKAIMVVAVTAMILILLSTFSCSGTDKEKTYSEEIFDATATEKSLEERITRLVTQISGTGDPTKIEVMITLDVTPTTLYEKDKRYQSDTESDESKISENRTAETEVVLAGSGKEPLTVGVVQPTVRGVSVVCEGAFDPLVCERVTNAVAKALDIGVSRVCVTY